ncbi:hypothetical protein ACBQ10_18680, partial [Kluyvera intermedia]|uniref:hypothetical protein n=1 Tax=Kluyvera intermedia TaxID=61648 RepID=UPI00352420BC
MIGRLGLKKWDSALRGGFPRVGVNASSRLPDGAVVARANAVTPGFYPPFISHTRKKAHPAGWASSLFDAWQFPTLAWGDPTLPSALRRFT